MPLQVSDGWEHKWRGDNEGYMRLKAKCEDYIGIFTEEAQRRQLHVSPRAFTLSIVSEDEPKQQSVEASKHETEDESGWETEGDPSPEPEHDQHVYTVFEQRPDGSQSDEPDEPFEDLEIMKRARIQKVCAHRTVANERAVRVSLVSYGKNVVKTFTCITGRL